MVVFFAAGDASVEAAVDFLLVELFFVVVALVVVPVDVAVVSSFF